MKCIDLFSGLGGFSEAFINRGHDVLRIDNDNRFKDIPYTTIKDVGTLTSTELQGAYIILASPPCTHFSVASVYRHWPKGVPTKATLKQINLVKYTIKIIKEAKPKYWIMENPIGKLRKVIGTPPLTVYMCAWGKKAKKPTDLWGQLPPIDIKMPMKWQKAPRGSKLGVQGYHDPAAAAMIPYDFSLAVCLAAEGNSPQQTLEI